MIKQLLNILIFLFCFNVFGQEKYSKKELTEDVQYFFNTIKEIHVNPYFYSKDIDSINDRIISGLPDQWDNDSFKHYLLIQTNNIWDTHTGLSDFYFAGKVTDSSSLIPNNFKIIDSDLFLIKDKKSYFVKSINNIPSKLILDRFYAYCKADMSSFIKNRFVEKYFSLMYNAEFGGFSRYDVCINNKDSYKIILQPIKYKDLYSPEKINKNFESFYFPRKSIAYLKISTFSGDRFDEFNLFLSRAFQQIDFLRIQTLIIDTRSNGGGSDNCVSALLDYIFDGNYNILYGFSMTKDDNGNIQNGSNTWVRKSKQEHIFNGKLILLQSAQTASAAMDLSSAIKTSSRGLIIGEPTLDPVYSFANAKYFVMPNTKISFRCAQGFYAMPGSNANVNIGVIPDLFYNFENDNLDLKEIMMIIKQAKEYYKGYFYFDYYK